MDFLKTAPEKLAQYLDFLLTFSRSPGQALEPFAAKEAGGQRVSWQLLLYISLSVGLAILLNMIGAAVGMADDSSWTNKVAGRIDKEALPLAAATLVVMIAAGWHALAKVVGWLLARISETPAFEGAVAGSINASLALVAWFLPLFMAVVISIRIAALHAAVPPLLFLIAVLPLSLLFPVYFVLALAASHRLSVVYASGLFGFTVIALTYLLHFLGSVN